MVTSFLASRIFFFSLLNWVSQNRSGLGPLRKTCCEITDGEELMMQGSVVEEGLHTLRMEVGGEVINQGKIALQLKQFENSPRNLATKNSMGPTLFRLLVKNLWLMSVFDCGSGVAKLI